MGLDDSEGDIGIKEEHTSSAFETLTYVLCTMYCQGEIKPLPRILL